MWFRDDVVLVSGIFCVFVCVLVRVPQQVLRSHFLLRLYTVGPLLQPMGGEHIYLSSRRSINPWGPASNPGAAPAVFFRVVPYGFQY